MNGRVAAALAGQAVAAVGEGLMLLVPFAAAAWLMHLADATGATLVYIPAVALIAVGFWHTCISLGAFD